MKKGERFFYCIALITGLALAITFLAGREVFAWGSGNSTHEWIVTQAIEYLKQKKIISSTSDVSTLSSGLWNGAGYADDTGKEVTAACHLLKIDFLGESADWDLDGLRHFFKTNEKIKIHSSDSFKDGFAHIAQTGAFCGDLVRTGEIAAPQYAKQLYNRAIEFWPGGKKELDLKTLSYPPYLGMVNSDGPNFVAYLKKTYYAGWTEGTDPKNIWSIGACLSPAGSGCNSYNCNFSGIWCCKDWSGSGPCTQNNAKAWPASAWGTTEKIAGFYLGWAVHMLQDLTVYPHITMDHGEPHQDYEHSVGTFVYKESNKTLKNLFPLKNPLCSTRQLLSSYMTDPNYTLPSPLPETWTKHCYNPVPDYLDELVTGKVNSNTLDIESFAKRVAQDVKSRCYFESNTMWINTSGGYAALIFSNGWNEATTAYIEICLDAAIKATAAVLYKHIKEIESYPLPADKFEPNDSLTSPKTIKLGRYYNLTFSTVNDADCYAFTIPANFQADLDIVVEYEDSGGFGMHPLFPNPDSAKLIGPDGKTYYLVADQKGKRLKLTNPFFGEYKLYLKAGRPINYNLIAERTLTPDITEGGQGDIPYDILGKGNETYAEFNIHNVLDKDIFYVGFNMFQPPKFINDFISVYISYDAGFGDIKLEVDYGKGYEEVEIYKPNYMVKPAGRDFLRSSLLSPASQIDLMESALLEYSESQSTVWKGILELPTVPKILRARRTSKCIFYLTWEAVKPVQIRVSCDAANTYTLHVKREPGSMVVPKCPGPPPGVPPGQYYGTGASASMTVPDFSYEVVSKDTAGNIFPFNLAENQIPLSARGVSFTLPLGALQGSGDIIIPSTYTHYFVVGSNSEGTELLLSSSEADLEGKTLEEILSLVLPEGGLFDQTTLSDIRSTVADREDLLTPYGSFATLYAISVTGPARAAGLIGTNRYSEYSSPADSRAMLATNPTNLSLTKPVANLTSRWDSGYGKMPITFDASHSYNPLTEILQYEWDWNGDGVFDETTTEPVAQHTFEDPSTTTVSVRVTGGGTATESMNVVLDPGFHAIGSFSTGETIQQYTRSFSVPIDPSLPQITFMASVNDRLADPSASGPLGLTLITPDGIVISPSSENAGFQSGPGFEAYTIESPVPGVWQMQLSEGTTVPIILGTIGQVSTEMSDIMLLVNVDQQIATVNEPITLRAELFDSITGPLFGASVVAKVQAPSANYSIDLYDDGEHGDESPHDGIYGNVFANTSEPGRYSFMVTASGIASSGFDFMRTGGADSIVNLPLDNDALPDEWEDMYKLDKYSDDTLIDIDEDGLTNLEEYLHKTNPAIRDSDRDGYCDGEEVAKGSDPLDPFSVPQYPGDLDGDHDVDNNDKVILQSYLDMTAANCPKCDLNHDGNINDLDIGQLENLCTRSECATNLPPVADPGGPYSAECQGESTTVQLDGSNSTDPDPFDTLTFLWSTDCPGSSFDYDTSPTPILTIGMSTPGNCTVTLTVTDSAGNSGSGLTNASIVDTTPPIITCPPDVTIGSDELTGPTNTGFATASDVCMSPQLSWQDDTAPGACPIVSTISRTWTAEDGLPSTSSCVQMITVMDTTAPQITIITPQPDIALQDVVTLQAQVTDVCEIEDVNFYVFELGKDPINGLAGTFNGENDLWEYPFDTTNLQDGYYVIAVKAKDKFGNEGWAQVITFSIRNWAVIALLPSTPNSKAGRTMPVKFSLRIAASVDPAMPFVYNEDLEIRIYDAKSPGTILQRSAYGTGSKDYRINGETYITNFQTGKTPATYVVEIWRPTKNFMVGSFTFKTVK